jgi:Repeat of Unknown Function (DUF347)
MRTNILRFGVDGVWGGEQSESAGEARAATSKVPQVAIAFWIIKIAATTLGETGGDALSMTMNFGYLLSTAIFMACFIAALSVQIRAKKFHPFLYWTVIVTTTTVGTTMADFANRSLGWGYVGGTVILFTLLMIVLGLWKYSVGSVSFSDIKTTKVEIFYWVTILFSNTLGTALGRFYGGHQRSRFRTRSADFFRHADAGRGRVLLHEAFAHCVVLDGIYFDPSAGGDAWRSADQTARQWRPRS